MTTPITPPTTTPKQQMDALDFNPLEELIDLSTFPKLAPQVRVAALKILCELYFGEKSKGGMTFDEYFPPYKPQEEFTEVALPEQPLVLDE